MDSNRLGNRFSVEENTSIDKWFLKVYSVASIDKDFNDVLFTVEAEIVDEWVALENRGLHFTRDKAHRSLEGYS
ncbi:MAG: hypothetical protein HA496_05270 [Thaumarchaeota archaeon]|jgi:hypothetical protein|nr:hypothetical protein [Nitrososphaerota archaeon]